MGYILEQSKQIKPKISAVGLKTSAELLMTAQKFGIPEKEISRNIKSLEGEQPKKIFSGGIIMDIFDGLNALQYGVTGLIKGKGFVEGVKTRQSFSDQDALGDYGLPGMIGGIALDIAVDPLTYAGGFGILKKGAQIVSKPAAKLIQETAGDLPVINKIGDFLGSKLIYRYGQDPIYKELAERSEKNILTGTQNLLDLARPLAELDPKDQRIIAEARKAGQLDKLSEEFLFKIKPIFDNLDKLGKDAVDLGLLNKNIYEQNVGKYIARLYRKHEIPLLEKKLPQIIEGMKPKRIDLSRFKKRQDIPEDIRTAMGEILEAGYPTAKALIQLNQAVERGKLFKEVSLKWAKSTFEEGMDVLPNIPRLGALSGKFVPKPIFDDIQEIIRIKTPFEKVQNKIIGTFKFGKVILNPATHARNIMSNFILNNFEGLNPARIDIYVKAAKEIIKKGAVYQEAKKMGLGLDSFASNEIKSWIVMPEVKNMLGSIYLGFRKAGNKLAELYGKEEEFAKMAQYIYQKSLGKTPEEAWKIAERATFNYAQVTPFIRKLRESIWGVPFITFSYKATPQIAKTLINTPTKISNIGKIKQAIESQSGAEELTKERASEPSWVRDGFYMKLPIKDKLGRSAYLDLTYIMPFGDLIAGQFLERQIRRETGLKEGLPQAVLGQSFAGGILKELSRNQDFFGNKIWLDSDPQEKQLKDISRYLFKIMSPPIIGDQIPSGYKADGTKTRTQIEKFLLGEESGIEQGGKQTRTLMQDLLKQAGIKIQPVDIDLQEILSEKNKIKALQTILQEKGQIRKFEVPLGL